MRIHTTLWLNQRQHWLLISPTLSLKLEAGGWMLQWYGIFPFVLLCTHVLFECFFEYWSNNVFHYLYVYGYLPYLHLMCTMYMPGSHGSQKEVWDPLGPELQMTEQQVPLAVNHLSSVRSILTSNIRTSEKRARNGTTPVIPALGRQENLMIKAA